MAETAWKPADQADPKRLCEGPGCMREFRPSKPGERFCSERCENAAATVAAARGEPAEDSGPRCAYSKCGKPFKPGKGGWNVKYHSLRCAQAAAAEREAAKQAAAATPAPEPAEPTITTTMSGSGGSSTRPGGMDEPAPDTPPAAPPEPDPAPTPAATDPLTHTDGFRSGVREATELTFTLMRSQAFRDLDPVVALQIIREVLGT